MSVRSPATGASDRELMPRMAGMPATMDGARFVGRDAAFIRLAPALEEAAGGEATAGSSTGPAGSASAGSSAKSRDGSVA